MIGSEQHFLMFLGESDRIPAGNVTMINEVDNSLHLESRFGINSLYVTVGLCGHNEGCMKLIMSGRDVPNILGLTSGLNLGLQFGDRFVDWILVRVCVVVMASLLEWSYQPQVCGSRFLEMKHWHWQ